MYRQTTDPPEACSSIDDVRKDDIHPQLFLRQSDPLPPPINDTLRLIFLSDTHGLHDEIPLPLPAGDILFHLGDACHRGNIAQMRSFVQWMKRNSFHKERIVIEGNHDRDKNDGVLDFMSEYDGVARVLKNEVVAVAGGKMSVAGVTWNACQEENFTEAMNNIQTWSDESDSVKRVEKKTVDLLLTHLGPRVKGGGRGWEVGSRVLSQFVKDVSPALHCFGHIHYARGVRKDSDVMMVNSASAKMMVPVVIDYCPDRKKALMIHCPVSDESMEDHFASVKFPTEWLVEAD